MTYTIPDIDYDHVEELHALAEYIDTHNEEHTPLLRACVEASRGYAFDGCHKIYLIMDNEQMAMFRRYEYDRPDKSHHFYSKNPHDPYPLTTDDIVDRLRDMYNDESCELRFICAVMTDPHGSNDAYIDIVPQMSTWKDGSHTIDPLR